MILRSHSKVENTASQIVDIGTNLHPIVVLNREYVADYLRNQNKVNSDVNANISVVSLHDSSDDENEKSVVFVSEEKPPELSPKSQCDALKKENKALKSRIRKVEIHVTALQKRIIDKEPQIPVEIDPSNENDTPVEDDPPFENITNALNFSLDPEWLNNQIEEIQNEGDFTAIAAEIAKHLEG